MTGLSAPTIYDVMQGRSSPSLETLSKLADGLQVTHVELLETYVAEVPKDPSS